MPTKDKSEKTTAMIYAAIRLREVVDMFRRENTIESHSFAEGIEFALEEMEYSLGHDLR